MNIKNNLTLLIDSNWLLQSRFSVLSKGFNSNNDNDTKQYYFNELKKLMAQSISSILNKLPIIDNIIFIADGGSWRKQLPTPKNNHGELYKGNRVQTSDIEWSLVYKVLNELLSKAKELGITVSQYNQIEGDDWIWYWSKKLNNEGINCLIWSSDNDLKQLIGVDGDTGAFTAWYNNKNGLWLPTELNKKQDTLDFFMNFEYYSPTLDRLKLLTHEVSYVNPSDIITSKIICGDNSDNILPIIRYTKGTRTYRITEKDWKSIAQKSNIYSVYDINNNINSIPNLISSEPKFIKLINNNELNINNDDLIESILYNEKLVWLHESIIPDTIIQFMNQQDYKLYDVKYIKNNYKVLATDENEDYIQNLFNI